MTETKLSPQVVRSLVFERLRDTQPTQIGELLEGIGELAKERGLVPRGRGLRETLGDQAHEGLYLEVQAICWQLVAQGVLAWGLNKSNEKYPFFRLTDYGRQAVSKYPPQPYDPDGFRQRFQNDVPRADPVVTGYLEEAIRAFNANCSRGAAILLGAASEKNLLLLHDKFGAKISDPDKKTKFDRDSSGISIHRKYRTLKDRLDRMVTAKKLTASLADTVNSDLPTGFELIRRHRNTAGHPELGATADIDSVFINLRMFVEYARRMGDLLDHFDTNVAEW